MESRKKVILLVKYQKEYIGCFIYFYILRMYIFTNVKIFYECIKNHSPVMTDHFQYNSLITQ